MIHIFKTLTIIILHNLFRFWKDNKNTMNNAETIKNDRTIIIMINEALPAIPIIVYTNKTVALKKNYFKRVWNCSLCFLSFLFVKHLSEGTYDLPYKTPCFSKQNKCEKLHLFALIACKWKAKN